MEANMRNARVSAMVNEKLALAEQTASFVDACLALSVANWNSICTEFMYSSFNSLVDQFMASRTSGRKSGVDGAGSLNGDYSQKYKNDKVNEMESLLPEAIADSLELQEEHSDKIGSYYDAEFNLIEITKNDVENLKVSGFTSLEFMEKLNKCIDTNWFLGGPEGIDLELHNFKDVERIYFDAEIYNNGESYCFLQFPADGKLKAYIALNLSDNVEYGDTFIEPRQYAEFMKLDRKGEHVDWNIGYETATPFDAYVHETGHAYDARSHTHNSWVKYRSKKVDKDYDNRTNYQFQFEKDTMERAGKIMENVSKDFITKKKFMWIFEKSYDPNPNLQERFIHNVDKVYGEQPRYKRAKDIFGNY